MMAGKCAMADGPRPRAIFWSIMPTSASSSKSSRAPSGMSTVNPLIVTLVPPSTSTVTAVSARAWIRSSSVSSAAALGLRSSGCFTSAGMTVTWGLRAGGLRVVVVMRVTFLGARMGSADQGGAPPPASAQSTRGGGLSGCREGDNLRIVGDQRVAVDHLDRERVRRDVGVHVCELLALTDLAARADVAVVDARVVLVEQVEDPSASQDQTACGHVHCRNARRHAGRRHVVLHRERDLVGLQRDELER